MEHVYKTARDSVVTGLIGLLLSILVGSANAADVVPPPAPAEIPSRDSSPVPGPAKATTIPGIGQVTLTWEPVPGAASYNVYANSVSADAAVASKTPKVRTKDLIAVVPSPSPEKQWFAVRAVTTNGEGQSSTPVTAEADPDAAPSDVKATGKDGQAVISWTSVGATSYHIDVRTDPDKAPIPGFAVDSIPGNNSTLSETVTGLKNGTTYFFMVSAVNESGKQAKAKNVWATPIATAAPTSAATTELYDITESGCGDLNTYQDLAPKLKAAEALATSKSTTNSTADSSNLSASSKAKPASSASPSTAELNSALIRAVQAALRAKPKNVDQARKCNGWLAQKTLEQQTTSSTLSVQAFPKFATSIADNSQLVTTHFVTAFTPTWLHNDAYFTVPSSNKGTYPSVDPDVNSHWYNDIGIDVSSSVPITSATLANYATQEILMRDGGLVNLYASFAGRNYSNVAYDWGNRKANIDRLYWIDILDDAQPATASETLAFISHGIGIKALKTALSGTANNLGAQGTAYAGVGFDGPLFNASQDSTSASKGAPNTPAGMLSLEIYVSENWLLNGQSTNALLGAKESGRSYSAYGANLSLFVTGNIGIQVQYASALGSGLGRAVGHVAMLSVSYTKAPTPTTTTTTSGVSLGPQAN